MDSCETASLEQVEPLISPRMEPVYTLANDTIKIDDKDALIVMVLPKDVGYPTGFKDESLDDAFAAYKQIFVADKTDDLKSQFPAAAMGKVAFAERVRGFLEDRLKSFGLTIRKFESIDGDMVFWKIDCPLDIAKKLALRVGYSMPFNREAYAKHQMEMPQLDGRDFPAYQVCDDEAEASYGAMRRVDKIRIVMQQLQRQFDLTALRKHQVVTKCFPAANYADMMTITKNMSLFLPLPHEYHAIRDYFGEEVAFFFRFHGYYIWALVPLVVPAVLVCLAQTPYFPLDIDFEQQNYVKVFFGVLLVIWATLFQRFFEFKANEECHRWGMHMNKDFELHELELSMWDESGMARSRSGAQATKHWYSYSLGNITMIVYMLVFVYAVLTLAFRVQDTTMRSYAFTGATFAFSFVWGKIAPLLKSLEGHRTESRGNQSLTKKLAFVKLFLFLFPLCNVAFLAGITRRQCDDTFDKVAASVFDRHAFDSVKSSVPLNSTYPPYVKWAERNRIDSHGAYAYAMELMSYFAMSEPLPKDKVCMKGCLPKKCDLGPSGDASCMTSCYFELQQSLTTLFFSHAACTASFIVIGMALVWYRVRNEKNAKSTKNTSQAYTFLQLQEKCFDESPYAYLSWGGSYVEDFLEVVLSFAVVASFGIISPFLSVFALAFQALENRLLLFRMLHVTCRPYPVGSEGIGAWHVVLELIVNIAIVINGLLIVVDMRTDMQTWNSRDKFCFFSMWTMSLLFFRIFTKTLMPEKSPDLVAKNDENAVFLRMVSTKRYRLPDDEKK
eukprot:TRINITY_DN31995_c0_g1_i1.p1 TRINITY_DN31995_c0_g1~~TRINITY_DN31995_c0_g1_i1.p1  ORF type:complete len:783 (+),score=80.72 TRINITY_DN31995_c0_g1_i1:60-2408(+)